MLDTTPGLPDAGLILKKLPLVGKLKFNQVWKEKKGSEKNGDGKKAV